MRLGGPVMKEFDNPEQWLTALEELDYTAAFCPVDENDSDEVIEEYKKAAAAADIVIAEVGAWSNPISPDDKTRKDAIQNCQQKLSLADKVGANCCVNIAGSCGEKWDGPHPDNLTEDTFDLIVETVREIIDTVKPVRTYYTLETMPWIYPDSAESYLRLVKAVDREHFAVHLDPVNLICSPQRYYGNGNIIQECFAKLGPYIKSCHGKDIILREKLTTHLDEACPGEGGLNYRVFLEELKQLDSDIPLMLEHLTAAEDYEKAANYVHSVAEDNHIEIK